MQPDGTVNHNFLISCYNKFLGVAEAWSKNKKTNIGRENFYLAPGFLHRVLHVPELGLSLAHTYVENALQPESEKFSILQH
jgi:hypothetical protein